MNDSTPAIWTTGTTEGFHTGTWRSAVPVHRDRPSPCRHACPVDGNIAVWIHHAANEDYRAAWLTLVANNPFPAIAGRVCHHPCEAACNRREHDEALAICALERFVGDLALAEGWSLPAPPRATAASVAVVGAGPSGLAAACQLRRAGIAVTVFEAQPEPGGLLRYGIPPYRLPRPILDGEIERLLALGIDLRTGERIDGWRGVEALRERFDAVYLAIGAARAKRLAQLDYAQPWVVDGAEYLARTSAGEHVALGARVAVIGGGSAAVDAARTALRQGAAVRIVALEARGQMPAQPEEVAEALEEGVEISAGAMLREVVPELSGLRLECVRVRFEAGVRRGEFRVEPIADGGFALAADTVVVSIGQDPDLDGDGPALDGALVGVDETLATSIPGVFAGGDVASLDRFVTHALGQGRRAAAAIHRFLHPGAVADAAGQGAATPFADVNTHYHPSAPRQGREVAPAAARVRGFEEVQHEFPEAAALAEAARCFSCGTCIFCDNCFYFCPDMAVRRVDGGYQVLTAYCKGCGLCVKECPTGAVTMRDEAR